MNQEEKDKLIEEFADRPVAAIVDACTAKVSHLIETLAKDVATKQNRDLRRQLFNPSAELDQIETWLASDSPDAALASPRMVLVARRLLAEAKEAREAWLKETATIRGAMRSAAVNALEKQKFEGFRTKQITEADVDLKTAELFSDEYVAQEQKDRRFRRLVEDRAHVLTSALAHARHLTARYAKW